MDVSTSHEALQALEDGDECAAAAAAETPIAPPPRHDLGVLLVHGIGEQKQGETLNEFATPILKWIDRWLEPDVKVQRLVGRIARHTATKDVEGRVELRHATLRPPELPLGTPAHAVATLVVGPPGGARQERSWLFAESWWSPQTLTPRVSLFLLWLITRGPWILLLHLAQAFAIPVLEVDAELVRPKAQRTRARGWLQWQLAKGVVATAIWLVVSLLLISAWGVVSLIALVPIGYVRARVYAVLQAITGVVGDSFVLINDPIQRAAFVATTRRALEWLRAQGCAKVAVVAHSQGAAVARDVLFAAGAPQADRFITFGPGIAKLDALDDRERIAAHEFLWCGAAAPLSLVALLAFLRLSAAGHEGFALWGFPVLFAAFAFGVIVVSWRSVGDALERLRPDVLKAILWRQYQPGLRWQDFWASSDPVSNGSLSATVTAGLRRIVSRKVRVLGSLLEDHTAYWLSRADFVGRVVHALDRCAGVGLFSAAGVGRVRRARRNYVHCVRLLVVLRWLGLLALLLPLLRLPTVLREGEAFAAWLQAQNIESVGTVIDGLRGALAWLAARTVPFSTHAAAGFVLLAALATLAVHVWARIVRYWWENMVGVALVPVFRPSAGREARIGQTLLAVLVIKLGLLPLALSAAWTIEPAAVTLATLDGFLAGFAKTAVMILYALLVAAGVALLIEQGGLLRAAWRTHRSLPAALRAAPGWWMVPVYWSALLGAGWAWRDLVT